MGDCHELLFFTVNPSISDFTEDNDYALTSPLDIQGVLKSLAKEQRLIQLHVPSGASILTTLLKIEPETGTLVFDGSSDASLEKHISSAKKLYFDVTQDGVHISFTIEGGATLCSFENMPALRLPIPAELIRIQRRDAFRVATPINNPVLCSIPVDNGAITLPLEDLSSGGLAASDNSQQFDRTVGKLYPGSLLRLPESEPLDVTLRLVHVRKFDRAEKEQYSLGFAFEYLRGSTLTRIQRYISALERAALARSRGF